ncbi:hypothetical protein ABW19_dt0201231 [Dactylella cylindrospora]|nr:hypothetical protein ABW19_dt0201231 [Dactylella cylindrospora]
MSAQAYQTGFAAPSRKPRVDADGVITYIDRNGDTVQTSNNNLFNGLRHAGGEAFLPSDDEEGVSSEYSSEDERQTPPPYLAQQAVNGVPMYAYAPSTSSSKKSKKSKKEKKEKKSKKERRSSPEYAAASGAQQHTCCSCGHGRH